MSAFGPNGMNIPANQFVMLGQPIPGYWAGEIDITVTQYNGVAVSPAKTVPTFCIELTQDVNLGTTYTTYTVGSVSVADQGTLTPTAIKDLTTLYYLFYQGNSSANWNATTATAFQLDCWKITSNSGNYIISGSSAGSTFYDNGWNTASGTAVINLAQSWLTTISGTTVVSGGSNTPEALLSSTAQDLLFTKQIQQNLIPFHINAWPGVAALGGLVFLRMRRRMKGAAKEAGGV
jgi:hypothetical protein